MFFNKKLIIKSVIFTLIILLLIGFLVYPILNSIRKSSEELIFLKKELAFSQGRFINFEEMKINYQRCKPELEKINDIFIDPNMPIDLIKFWEKTAAGSNVSVDISPLSLKLSSPNDCWDSIAFRITVDGFSPDLMRFIEEIEAGPYLTEIKNLVIKRERLPLEEGEKRVEGILTVKVFTK